MQPFLVFQGPKGGKEVNRPRPAKEQRLGARRTNDRKVFIGKEVGRLELVGGAKPKRSHV